MSESLQTAVSGSFAMVVGLLIATPLLLAFLASQVNLASVADRARRRAALAERVGALRTRPGTGPGSVRLSPSHSGTSGPGSPPLSPSQFSSPTLGGSNMPLQRRRLMLGLGILAVAAVVGFIGWYKLAGEPLLNRQIPYLASAGIAVVILAALGGALLVADQLRGDDYRIEELEAAVRTLADSLAPAIEAPARLRGRTSGSASGPATAAGAGSGAGGASSGAASGPASEHEESPRAVAGKPTATRARARKAPARSSPETP